MDANLPAAFRFLRGVGLISFEDLARADLARAAVERQVAEGAELFPMDCIDDVTLAACGRLIWEVRAPSQLVVGSQGVEYALVRHWREAELLADNSAPGSIGAVDRMAVVSGSVSPVTAAQIAWSAENGVRRHRVRRARGASATRNGRNGPRRLRWPRRCRRSTGA